MDITSLSIFVEVMRRGSFAAVARDHHVDPSSVSRTVAALEEELGLRLFHRTTRRLSPTEAGAVYFDRVEPLVEELERARLKAVDLGARPQGVLRITAPVSFAELNLVPLLPEIARTYPDLHFDLILTDTIPDLLADRIDVALCLGPQPPAEVVSQPLARMVARVCASPAYLKRHGRPQRPADLAEHNCLLLRFPGFGDRWRFRNRQGEESEVQVHGNLHTSHAVALKTCALEGMGVTLQARWIVGQELQNGKLVDLFPEHEVTAATFDAPAIWLVYPERRYIPLKVQVFAQALRRAFETGLPGDPAIADLQDPT